MQGLAKIKFINVTESSQSRTFKLFAIIHILVCFAVIPTLAQWHVTQDKSNTTHLMDAEILQDSLGILSKLIISDTPNFAKENHRSVHISNCTYLYFTNSSHNEIGAEGQEGCSYMTIETLYKILQNNYIEILIDHSCIMDKIRDSNIKYSAKSHDFLGINVDGSLDDLHQHRKDMDIREKEHEQINNNENLKNYPLNNYILRDELSEVKIILQSIQKIKMFQKATLKNSDFMSIHNQLQTIRSFFIKNDEYENETFSTKNIDVYLTNVSEENPISLYNYMSQIQNGSILSDILWIRCLLTLKLSDELDEEFDQNEVPIIKIFHKYVDPIVNSLIFTIGVILNGILILIFVRQRQLWTPPNIMLFNLALVDLFALFFSVLAFCFSKNVQPFMDNNESMCKYFVTIRPLTIALSCLSVVVLSILRYAATGKKFALHSTQDLCNLSTRTRFILYIMIVWLLSLALSFPYPLMVTFSNGKCFKYGDNNISKVVTLFEFLFYCVLLPCIMVVFNTMTVRRLRESTRELNSSLKQNGIEAIRHRTANMLMTYIIIFLITYVPHYFLRVLRPYDLVQTWEITYRCLYKVSYYMVFANYIFNPLILYILSGTFHSLFNHYFSTAYNMVINIMKQCNKK